MKWGAQEEYFNDATSILQLVNHLVMHAGKTYEEEYFIWSPFFLFEYRKTEEKKNFNKNKYSNLHKLMFIDCHLFLYFSLHSKERSERIITISGLNYWSNLWLKFKTKSLINSNTSGLFTFVRIWMWSEHTIIDIRSLNRSAFMRRPTWVEEIFDFQIKFSWRVC